MPKHQCERCHKRIPRAYQESHKKNCLWIKNPAALAKKLKNIQNGK